MSILKRFFSINNNSSGLTKDITILGIKFSIKFNIEKRYRKIIQKIRKQNGKINVAFLVNEISKWKTQSLYDLMKQSELFNPVVALTIADKQRQLSPKQQKEILKQNYNYFHSKGMDCIYFYDFKKNKPVSLKSFNPRIVFYQQPWDIHKLQSPKEVSKYALTCYVPYFVPNYGILYMDCEQPFHKQLFRYYVLNEEWEKIYKDDIGNCSGDIKGLGHTVLDYFYLHNGETKNDYVIYAPHWSIYHKNNPEEEHYSTFDVNGETILEYAKNHPEINWAFKPHPTLKIALKNIGWNEEKISNYYSEWEKFANCCYDSDYLELFLNSKAIITDCGSFLTEYFCTGKPILHLISKHCKVIPPKPTKKIFDTFYKIHDNNELFKYLDDIIIGNNDPMIEYRRQTLKELGLANNYAAKNIIEDLERVIKDGYNESA